MDNVATRYVVYVGPVFHFTSTNIPKVLRVRVDAPITLRMWWLIHECSLSNSQTDKQIADIDTKTRNVADFSNDADDDSLDRRDINLNARNEGVDSSSEVEYRPSPRGADSRTGGLGAIISLLGVVWLCGALRCLPRWTRPREFSTPARLPFRASE